MPSSIHPMLAESITDPFDNEDWLFEIKWDGYRAIAFIDGGKVRLVSRNQNELTARYPELKDMPHFIKAKTPSSMVKWSRSTMTAKLHSA